MSGTKLLANVPVEALVAILPALEHKYPPVTLKETASLVSESERLKLAEKVGANQVVIDIKASILDRTKK